MVKHTIVLTILLLGFSAQAAEQDYGLGSDTPVRRIEESLPPTPDFEQTAHKKIGGFSSREEVEAELEQVDQGIDGYMIRESLLRTLQRFPYYKEDK